MSRFHHRVGQSLLIGLAVWLCYACPSQRPLIISPTKPELPSLPAEEPASSFIDSEPAQIPELPVPSPPQRIMGQGLVPAFYLSAFLLKANPRADVDFVQGLAVIYIEEATTEGVNHDVAFSQMCLETGYLGFGGLVTADMNNFCGLGALGLEQPGVSFPSPRIGVRAHIQHLKGYADHQPPLLALVDPRYKWLSYGSAPEIADLTGRWAQDPAYGDKIISILKRLYQLAFSG